MIVHGDIDKVGYDLVDLIGQDLDAEESWRKLIVEMDKVEADPTSSKTQPQ